MRRVTTQLVVATLITVAFVLTAVSGLVLYIPGRLLPVFGISLLTWRAIHEWSALVLTAAVIAHVVLHRRRVGEMLARLARPAGAPRNAAGQDLLPRGSAGRVTMGVGIGEDELGGLRTVIGTSEPGGYLRPDVGAAIRNGEEVATGAGHAEQSILDCMSANGIRPLTVAAGRPICPNCAGEIFNSSASPATPLK